MYGPQPSPNGWGTFSPAGSTGYPTTQPAQWPTPYFTGQPPPSTPYEPIVMTANPAGAWYDPASVRTGYEVSFTRYFYKPQPLRTLEEIRADILAVERETEGLLAEIVGSGRR